MTLRGRFREGRLPSYGAAVAAKRKHPRNIADLKMCSARVLPSAALPEIGYLIDGRAYDRCSMVISRCIGWDVMIDRQQQPWVIERWMCHNGIFVSEAPVGAGFCGLKRERPARGERR